jgi:hypothetical protein
VQADDVRRLPRNVVAYLVGLRTLLGHPLDRRDR